MCVKHLQAGKESAEGHQDPVKAAQQAPHVSFEKYFPEDMNTNTASGKCQDIEISENGLSIATNETATCIHNPD
jgi:hypothetical protein